MLKNILKIKNIKLKSSKYISTYDINVITLSPFMLRATATQLQFSSPGLITPATDIAYNKMYFLQMQSLEEIQHIV